jgi:DNA primase large subunit
MSEDVLVDGGITFRMYLLKSKFMNSEESINTYDKDKVNHRQQLQRVYSEIIHGNLAEIRQEQANEKCEKYWFLSKNYRQRSFPM